MDHPDDVKRDKRIMKEGGKYVQRNNLIFIKNINHNIGLAIRLSKQDGNIILHKTLGYARKNAYAKLPSIINIFKNVASQDCVSGYNIIHNNGERREQPAIVNSMFSALDTTSWEDILYAFDKVNGYEPKTHDQIILDAKSSIALAKKLLTRRIL